VIKSILGEGKREFSEAPQLIQVSYFLPAEGTMFWAILDTHYRIQHNKSQSQNKITTSLPTKILLFNKQRLIFIKLLFGFPKHITGFM